MKLATLLAFVACAIGVGCNKPKAPEGQPGGAATAPGATQQDAGQAAQEGGAQAPGRYALSREKLDGYVKYQRALIAVYDTLLKDLEQAPPPPADGGRPSAAAVGATMRILQHRAKAEEQARKEAGLTEDDVRAIDKVVTAVINRRSMARLFDADAAIKQWEQMRKNVSEGQRAEIDRTIAEMKQQQEETQKLVEERKQYGDANVDLVLTREDELIRTQETYLQRMSGRK